MSEVQSTEVTYKSLDFLGFPDYKVGDNGKVLSARRPRNKNTRFTFEIAEQIREKFASGGVTVRQISKSLNCTVSSIQQILWGIAWKKKEWRELVLRPNPVGGYMLVTLCNDEHQTTIAVHRLVLLAFVGPCPEGMEACHYPNRDPSDNRLSNLRWDTHVENKKDQIPQGTHLRGEKVGNSKLTAKDVLKIREMRLEGITQKYIAELFGLSRAYVSDIGLRRTWKHI